MMMMMMMMTGDYRGKRQPVPGVSDSLDGQAHMRGPRKKNDSSVEHTRSRRN
jgi:hypothetical protein